MSNVYPAITRWVLGQASYNQPNAMIAAAEQFMRQETPKSEGYLIIVDSSAEPSKATEYYERIVMDDPNVLFFHIPFRPGREYDNGVVVDMDRFPNAYRWMNGPFADIYKATIPTDLQLADRYITAPDIQKTLFNYHPRAHAEVLAAIGAPVDKMASKELWARAVTEFTSRRGFQTRPHLGSIRNFIAGVAEYVGAQAVVNLDDDHIGQGYAQSQINALTNAAFTGKLRYLTLHYTDHRRDAGLPPLWAMSDLLDTEKGYLVDFHGDPIPGHELKAQKSMGWTQARRIGTNFPPVPDILGGEDRGTEQRYRDAGHVVNLQKDFCNQAIRLVFGNGTSNNLITMELPDGHALLPVLDTQEEVLSYLLSLNASNPVEPVYQPKPKRAKGRMPGKPPVSSASQRQACAL